MHVTFPAEAIRAIKLADRIVLANRPDGRATHAELGPEIEALTANTNNPEGRGIRRARWANRQMAFLIQLTRNRASGEESADDSRE